MVLNEILNPILNPLLKLGAFWTILIVSLVVSVVTVIIYRYATDQERLRKVKADMKRYQKKAMAARDDPQKAMKLQKEIMKLNGEYMRSSFKSTLYTFLPIILFFGWLGANLAFMPLLPGEPFAVTATFKEGVAGQATLQLPRALSINDTLTKNVTAEQLLVWSDISGPAGTYDASISHSGGEEQFFTIFIDEESYMNPLNELRKDSEVFNAITVGNEKLLIFDGVFLFKDIPWVKTFGWFGAYFLFSIVFSTALRKILKVA